MHRVVDQGNLLLTVRKRTSDVGEEARLQAVLRYVPSSLVVDGIRRMGCVAFDKGSLCSQAQCSTMTLCFDCFVCSKALVYDSE